ncbi:uncharacterized protein N7529_007803 [Penicillium soppii]|uniref:uncharacterized protein n=1 Tax=Penicillium soppii TaxID=69789 RepID=UPI002546E5E2|nr:uncharacterized protein N7529_007803 [Penicillium soppii]KAJ5860493.1 hypothetical protein N7529_007803 [Penicillium soppii]
MTSPYEADPDKIPAADLYADVPCYGRYCPKPDDFHVDHQHVNSQGPESLTYWASVIDICTEENRIYPADAGDRDVFALGSTIVKSSHLHATGDTQSPEIDFSYADANEIKAITLAKTVLSDIKVPEIYFAGKVISFFLHLSSPITYVCFFRSMVVKYSFKKGFQVLDCLLHGHIYPENKRNHIKNRPEKHYINFTLSSQPRDSKLALTL